MSRSRCFTLAWISVLILFLSVQIVPKAQAGSSKIDGFGIGSGTHLRVGTEGLSNALDKQQWMGVHWSREDLPWAEVESPIGQIRTQYSFQLKDGSNVSRDFNLLLDESAKRGIQVVFILDYGPYYRDTITSQEDFLEHWKTYVTLAVNTFGDRVHYWEIENEMNSTSMWSKVTGQNSVDPEFYAKMLQAANEIIKHKDSNAITLLGGLVFDPSSCNNNPYEYLKQMHDLGAWDSFDAISFHTYWGNNNPEAYIERGPTCVNESPTRNLVQEVRELHDLAQEFGSKPIWITEVGWDQTVLEKRAGERGTIPDLVEADYLVRTYVPLLSEPGVDKVFWYTQYDDQSGIGEDYALGADGQQALHNLSYFLTGSQALGQVQGMQDKGGAGDDDVYEYRFKKDGATIIVTWKARGGDTLREVSIDNLSGSEASMILADSEDTSQDLATKLPIVDGKITLDLSERPVIITVPSQGWLAGMWDNIKISFGQWWDNLSQQAQHQLDNWWREQSQKLEEQFNQWLVTLEEEFANWFAQKMSSFFNQLCGGTAMVPTIALAAVLVDKQRHRKNRK